MTKSEVSNQRMPCLVHGLLATVALIAAINASGMLHAEEDDVTSLLLVEDMPLDLATLTGAFEVEFADSNQIRLLAGEGESRQRLEVAWFLLPPQPTGDRAFSTPAYMERQQRFCDLNFGGACVMSVIDAEDGPQIAIRVVRDRDEVVILENRRFLGLYSLNVTSMVPSEMDAVGEQNFAIFLEAAEAYFAQEE